MKQSLLKALLLFIVLHLSKDVYGIVVNTHHTDCPNNYCGLPPHVEVIDGVEYVDHK